MQTKNFHPVSACNDGLFNAASGIIISIDHPTVEMIELDDIAAGLSNTSRFGGQYEGETYNVAQHSVLASMMAPKELKKVALFHDASEAYLGDVIKPLKVKLGNAYAEIEQRFMQVIFQKFGIDIDKLDLIKSIDDELLQIEHEYLQQGELSAMSDLFKRLGINEVCNKTWESTYSRHMFRKHFHFYC